MAYISAVSSQIAEPGSIVVRSLAKRCCDGSAARERIPLDRTPMRSGYLFCIYSLDWTPPLRAHLLQRNNMVTS
jgi:hypothetical protein